MPPVSNPSRGISPTSNSSVSIPVEDYRPPKFTIPGSTNSITLTLGVVLGALNLDGRRIDRVVDVSEQPSNGDETDVEKAEFSIVQGMIVKWWAVKTIDINEAINQGFIDKIKGWSYSRIPVIGKSEGKAAESEIWEGTKIFGFVHIKVRVCSHTCTPVLHCYAQAQGARHTRPFLPPPPQTILISTEESRTYNTIDIRQGLEEDVLC